MKPLLPWLFLTTMIPCGLSAQDFEFLFPIPARDIEYGGNGILWSVSQHHYGMRIDLGTGEILDTVYFAIPSENDGRGVAWDGATLWYSEWDFDQIYNLDPNTGTSIRQFSSPGFGPQALAWGEGYLWHTDEYRSEIFRIDPRTGETVGSLSHPEPYQLPVALAYCNGELYTGSGYTGNIFRLDPLNGNILDFYTFQHGTMGDFACDQEYLYVGGDDGLYRLPLPTSPIEVSASLDNAWLPVAAEGDTIPMNVTTINASIDIADLPFRILLAVPGGITPKILVERNTVAHPGRTTVRMSELRITENHPSGTYELYAQWGNGYEFEGNHFLFDKLASTAGSNLKWLTSRTYPNPFNPTTVIEYNLIKAGFVSLKVFNVL